MGNIITGGGRKRVKVMKINGETFKVKIPTTALDVTKDHPEHILLDSEAVKQFGIRAKPLEPQQHLNPNKIYFLVEIPKFTTSEDYHNNHDHDHQMRSARRVRSGINISAKDSLECLMLSRRSVSDLTSSSGLQASGVPGPVRLKMRLPRAQVEKLVEESKNEVEVAEKIIHLCMGNDGAASGDDGGGLLRRDELKLGRTENRKAREKRVSFLPIEEGEIGFAVAAS